MICAPDLERRDAPPYDRRMEHADGMRSHDAERGFAATANLDHLGLGIGVKLEPFDRSAGGELGEFDRTAKASSAGRESGAGNPERIDVATGGSLERFCVALCHDLRGPVATAGAALHRLAHSVATQPGDLPRLVEIARQSLAKADELLTSLPALLERERVAGLAPVALEDLVEMVRGDVDFELRLAGATFEIRGRMPVVLADAERLRIALRNLVRNAVQHRRQGIALVVTLRAWRRGATWTLTLSDNGAGIPRGARTRVFAPLQRAHGGSSSGGLGLTLVRQAIEASGGSIAVSSRPGVGASFAITLRAAAEAAAADAPPAAARSGP